MDREVRGRTPVAIQITISNGARIPSGPSGAESSEWSTLRATSRSCLRSRAAVGQRLLEAIRDDGQAEVLRDVTLVG